MSEGHSSENSYIGNTYEPFYISICISTLPTQYTGFEISDCPIARGNQIFTWATKFWHLVALRATKFHRWSKNVSINYGGTNEAATFRVRDHTDRANSHNLARRVSHDCKAQGTRTSAMTATCLFKWVYYNSDLQRPKNVTVIQKTLLTWLIVIQTRQKRQKLPEASKVVMRNIECEYFCRRGKTIAL